MRIFKTIKKAKTISLEIKKYSTENNKVYEKATQIYQTETTDGFFYPIFQSVVHGFENLYFFPHDTFDLSWSVSIMIGALILRIFLFPIALKNMKNTVKYSEISPQIQELNQKIINNPKQREYYKKQIDEIQKKVGVSMKQILGLTIIQVPFNILAFFSLRELSTFSELKDQGMLWFPDLTISDPYLILPISMAIFNMIAMEIPSYYQTRIPTKIEKIGRWVFRGLLILMIPVTYTFPSALFLAWTTSAIWTIFQNLLFNHPKSRNYLKIPILNSQLKEFNSYNNLIKNQQSFKLFSQSELHEIKKKK